jgi:uncharacterized protein YhjY with autotransporter beta-barrel domain
MRVACACGWARLAAASVLVLVQAIAFAPEAIAQSPRACLVAVGNIVGLPAEQFNPLVDRCVAAVQQIVAQPGTVIVTTTAFTGALFGRLDGLQLNGPGPDASGSLSADAAPEGMMRLGASRTSSGPAGGSRLTAFSFGTYGGGTRSDATNVAGFDYAITSGTIGVEYSANRNLIVGLAGNYATAGADIHDGGTVDVDAAQAAAYVSYATRQWFVDALAAFGRHYVNLSRPGTTDAIHGATDATTAALAVRGAYLFDFGAVRAGPIAGLTYIHASVGGYTEQGDKSLAMTVSAYSIDMLTGSVGLRFLAPFTHRGGIVAPFLNVTLEHNFGDSTTLLTSSLTTSPSAPLLSAVPNFDARSYGKVEGGVMFEIGPSINATLNAASTFARSDGNDYRVGAGLNYRF